MAIQIGSDVSEQNEFTFSPKMFTIGKELIFLSNLIVKIIKSLTVAIFLLELLLFIVTEDGINSSSREELSFTIMFTTSVTLLSSDFIVIVVLPLFKAFTSPVLSTDAIFSSLDM